MTSAPATGRRLALGYMSALGAGLSYGSVALVARKIVNDYSSPLVATAFSIAIGSVIVVGLFHRHALQDMPSAPRRAWLMLLLSGCASAWGVAFWFLAFEHAPVVLVAPLAGTSPLVSILLTHIFLQRLERVTWRTVFGAVLVVVGVALIAVDQ